MDLFGEYGVHVEFISPNSYYWTLVGWGGGGATNTNLPLEHTIIAFWNYLE